MTMIGTDLTINQ